MKFYDTITEMNSCNMALAALTKEEVTAIFAGAGEQPKNSNMEPDDSYVSGEVQYIFDKEDNSLNEVLIYPCYEEDDSLTNGDFINAPDSFWGEEKEKEAREYLAAH